ncbi:uncharacterized protein LOC128223703 isoform X2 [Mya arenaria]|uniref:uncharacterized protein LOC128223703 isoform X2 n=1 Tax=Mya arenaria TaxID=6604 RepID=UPI0022E5FECE|nr:uncharacterized protein LOC128223703 isoform X2 [Mya arenaria]
MAFLGYSDDFDLDDDGILRDSTESSTHWMDSIIDNKTGGILIDDDGIVRDDFDLLSKHGSSTHWTDSGLGGDKPTSTPSTLRQLDLQSYPSFEDVSRNFDESNVNISDFEASKDDLSFDRDFDDTKDNEKSYSKGGNRSGLSSRSSFDHSLNYDDTFDERDKKSEPKQDLFGEEYYKQLQELGVLVDEEDLPQPRDSLQEFENLESNYSRDYDDDDDESRVADEIEQFLRNDAPTPTRESMDIEGPNHSVNQPNKPLYDSQGFDAFDRDNYEINEGKRTRPNTASSTRTISSRSFPEISPEEALELYTERLQSLENDQDSLSIPFDQSQSQRSEQNVNEDDDEIYFVASQEHDEDDSPNPAKMPAYDNENKPSVTPKFKSRSRSEHSSDGSRSGTPQGQGYSDSERSRSVTPQGYPDNMENNGYQSNDDRFDSLTQVTRLDSRNKTQTESDTFRPDSALSELSAAASESRSVRPKAKIKENGKPPTQQNSGLSHARSQESFFEHTSLSIPKKSEKGPKRLLPKPSPEENQALKLRCKSVSNLNAQGPVKPTHMTLSEIRSINSGDPHLHIDLPEIEHDQDPDPEPKSGASDAPKGDLTKKLKQESSKRAQATQLVKQLQSDYDKLLSKYALAELTIDQMRLGAKISLHSASPTPSQATSGSLQSAQHLHLMQLGGTQRGSIASASPHMATPNAFFPEAPQVPSESGGVGTHARGTSPALLPRSDSTNSIDSTSTPRGDVEEPGGIANDAEQVKLGLMFQARNLDDRMQSFQALLAENHLTVEEQEDVFDKIRGDHEKLRSDYLQSKEDYNVLRRSAPGGLDAAFDQEKELEGQLFQIGMKFDEIHEKVEDNMKEKATKRQPFQQSRRGSADNLNTSMDVDPSTENVKKKIRGVSAGNDMLEPRRDPAFDDKLKRLHEDYNALMDRYRRLKQMAKTPEREQEIDHLVRKLHKICQEEPEIFKLPADLQSGWQHESAQADSHGKSRSTENISRSQDNLNSSMASNRSFRSERDYDDRSSGQGTDIHRRPERSGSYSSLSSRGRHTPDLSYRGDTGSPNPSLPRPRRHDYPDRERRERRDLKKVLDLLRESTSSLGTDSGIASLNTHRSNTDSGIASLNTHRSYSDSGIASLNTHRSQRPEGGSTTSLQDSGISEHEGGATGGPSALSKLPGPGKFKQMTGRREPDTDSGFIGSMVGSEVSAGNLSSRRQPQSPLRLRHPADPRDQSTRKWGLYSFSPDFKWQRPSSRQSSRSEDSAHGTTPRSGRSVASSRSARRTPTKAFPLESKQTETETQARAKTPTRDDRQTPTRPDSSRSKQAQGQKTPQRSRDYTDDSYTSVTESEMSYDTDRRRNSRPSSRNTSQRHIDRIMEDSEEESFSVDPTLNETTDLNMSSLTSDFEKPNVKQNRKPEVKQVNQTPKKTQETSTSKSGSKVNRQPSKTQGQGQGQGQVGVRGQQGRRKGDVTDTDTSLSLSLARDTTRDLTHDTTEDTYTSDETTPRSVIERERKQARIARQQAPPQEDGVTKAPATVTQAAPPKRATTPVKAKKSEVHPKRLHDSSMELSPETGLVRGPEMRLPLGLPTRAVRGPDLTKPKYVDRSIGSGSEETILASDAETAATGATRDSVNSARLKTLSSEIDKLRQEFVRANQERPQPQPLPPSQPPPPQERDPYYDQYFDPTEDPMAFMRGPRRRANSFSGHGGRDWGYDWTLPNVHRDGDIPLGYAAADAYAPPGHQKHRRDDGQQGDQRPRGRNRLKKRISQRNSGTQHAPDQNGYESDQSPNRAPVESQGVRGHYGFYEAAPQQASPMATATLTQPGNLQEGRRVFGSQPNLSYQGYQPPPPARSTASGSSTGQTGSNRPLRQTLYSYAANPTQNRPQQGYQDTDYHSHSNKVPYSQRQYASDDIHVNDGQTRFIPNGAREGVGRQEGGGVYTSVCPMCGSSAYHTHGDYVYPPEDHRQPLGYLVHDGRQLLDPVQVPVYTLPLNINLPARPRPLATQSFRSPVISSLPFRVYKAPPPIKQNLLPFNLLHKVKVQFETTPQKPQPMAASHEAVHQPIIEWDTQDEAGTGSRSRARSRSLGRAGRIRHYSPDGRVKSRYFVREFGDVSSESAESEEEEELTRRRSRSVGRRQRLRHGRKYRRVRGEDEYESDRGLGGGGLSLKKKKSKYRTKSQPNLLATGKGNNKISVAGEDDLERSLRLVEEIDHLTHKMMGTVSGELSKSRRMKDFGSSVW